MLRSTFSPALDDPQFVSAEYFPAPSPNWRLTFSRPIVATDGPPDPLRWRVVQGVLDITPNVVNLVAGTIRLFHPNFTPFDDEVLYTGPPPKFLDPLNSWVRPFAGPLFKP